MSPQYAFSLPYEAFDLDLIDLGPDEVGSGEFAERVSAFFSRQFAQLGGKARVVLNDTERTIEVSWTKESHFQDPGDLANNLLKAGKLNEAVPLLWTRLQEHPSDAETLYNLGVAHSELGQVAKAIEILKRLIAIEPDHVHGLVGLGVAHIRMQQLQFGEECLRRALRLEPRNLWALRNLGACLLKQGRASDAIPVLEAALGTAPADLQSIIGLGQALEEVGRVEDADEQYKKAIGLDGPRQLLDLAKERRTAIAHKSMRERGELRPDVIMYITGALEKFAGMSQSQIQSIGVEIAILGQSGLDINDPEQKYSSRSLPGRFSGLHLVSIMYAAFKQIAPTEDVGIDFSKEYEAAREMLGE